MNDWIPTAVKNWKNWSFNACAIAGFSASSLSVLLIIVNALTGNIFLNVLVPVAMVSLVVGGALSVRAHILWLNGNKKPSMKRDPKIRR